jgi:hypothetical protein
MYRTSGTSDEPARASGPRLNGPELPSRRAGRPEVLDLPRPRPGAAHDLHRRRPRRRLPPVPTATPRHPTARFGAQIRSPQPKNAQVSAPGQPSTLNRGPCQVWMRLPSGSARADGLSRRHRPGRRATWRWQPGAGRSRFRCARLLRRRGCCLLPARAVGRRVRAAAARGGRSAESAARTVTAGAGRHRGWAPADIPARRGGAVTYITSADHLEEPAMGGASPR